MFLFFDRLSNKFWIDKQFSLKSYYIVRKLDLVQAENLLIGVDFLKPGEHFLAFLGLKVCQRLAFMHQSCFLHEAEAGDLDVNWELGEFNSSFHFKWNINLIWTS